MFSVRVGLACANLVLLSALGCGGSDAGLDFQPETEGLEVFGPPVARGQFRICETYVDRDPVSGAQEVQYERYDFEALNAELQARPELARTAGIDTVQTCEQARHVAEARLYVEELAMVKDPIAALEVPWPTEVRDGGAGVRNIWQGDASGDQRILLLQFPLSLGSPGDAAGGSPAASCSSIAISPRHLLTAAHCIPPAATTYWRASVLRATASGTNKGDPVWLGNYRIRIYQHPGWSGTGDTGDDVALLSMERQCVTNQERDAETLCTGAPYERDTEDLFRLWIGNLGAGTSMQIKGWGTSSRYSNTATKLRYGDGGAHITLDWVGPRHYFTDDEDHGLICKGDSGGPSIMDLDWTDYAAGITSNFQNYNDQLCTSTTGGSANRRQRWHRISATFEDWVEPKLADNPWYTCPDTGANCCLRASSAGGYHWGNNTYVRCW